MQYFLSAMRIVFVFTLIFPMLTLGAVEFEPLSMIAMVTASIMVLVCWRRIRQPRTALIAGLALLCLAVLVAATYAQSLRFPGNPWEHPAWSYVRTLIGPVDGASSLIPAQTRADIVAWSPILAFVVALHLFSRREEAFLLIRILSHLAVGVAVLSLVQFLVAPMTVGLEAKTAYLGSLTGFYVNRNSAGTFFGIGVVVNAGLIFFHLRSSSAASLYRRMWTPAYLTGSEKTALYLSLGLLMEVLALAATHSRGATAATFLALILLGWIFTKGGASVKRARMRWQQFVIASGFMSVIAVVVGQETIYRMNAQSVDQARLCTYESTWQAVRDNWPQGAGFGSFADVFPAYRSPSCSGIDGVWDAAHNSYLEGMLGLGAPFVAVVAVAFVALGWALIIGLRERRSYRFAPAIGLAALLLTALHSLVDFSLQIPGNALFLAALLAACVTISLEGMEKAAGRRPPNIRDAKRGDIVKQNDAITEAIPAPAIGLAPVSLSPYQ